MYMGARLHEAHFSNEVMRSGMGTMQLTRKTAGGMIMGVSFLCDHFCLGVKDCFAFLENPTVYQDMLDKLRMNEEIEAADPGKIKTYVTGLVRWAKEIGFDPAPDYRFCSQIFQGIADNLDVSFQYGKDGMPFYINGPHDTPQRVRQIADKLAAYQGRTGEQTDYLIIAPDGARIPEGIAELAGKKVAPIKSTRKLSMSPLEFLTKRKSGK